MFKQILICFTVLVFSVAGCSSVETRRNAERSLENKAQGGKILIVNTNANVERYRVAEEAFLPLFNAGEVESINLSGESEPLEVLLDQVNGSEYQSVYCIGAKSLGLIDYIDPELPVVYSSVLNWRRFEKSPGYYGVASEVSLVAQLTWFKYLFPELSKLGVLYSDANQAMVKEAVSQAEKLGIELIASSLESPDKLEMELRTLLSESEALWLVSDPIVLSSQKRVEYLFEEAKSQHKPVFAYDSIYVDMGAALAIAADLPTSARQAALVMKGLLGLGYNGDSITYPAGSNIILNMKALEGSKLKLNEDALDSISEIRD